MPCRVVPGRATESPPALPVSDFVGETCRHLSSPAFAVPQVESCVKKRALGEERCGDPRFREEAGSVLRGAFHRGLVRRSAPLLLGFSPTSPEGCPRRVIPMADACGERTRASSGVAATVDVPRCSRCVERRGSARLVASTPLGDPARSRESVVRPDTWPVSRCGWARREAWRFR